MLVLLPTDKNKLLMGWKGPYEVVEKLSPLDYPISIDGKETRFDVYETLCPQQMHVHKGDQIKN